MLRRFAALALLLCASATPAAAQSDDSHRPIDLRYAGKYRNDPWFADQPARFRAATEEGFQRAADGLGIDRATLDVGLFRVYMDDARSNSSTWVRVTRAWMECSGYPGDRNGIELRITTESMRNGFGADLAQGITHELTHALMRATCPGYRTVPKWIREGMALFVAEQGPVRVTMFLSRAKFAADPSKLLNGLETFGGTHTLDDYAEDYLAMLYLEQVGGAGAVKKLQAALSTNTPWRTAVRTISGLPWPEFQRGAHAFARAELVTHNNAGLKQFAALSTARMSRRYAEAITLADRYLATFPDSPYRKMGFYHRARAHHATKQYAKAIADFAMAAEIGTPYTGYDDDLLFWWGWNLYKTGKYAAAAAKFEAVLRDHPGYADPVGAAYFWGLALGKSGAPNARTVLTKAMAAFPTPRESWMMPAAKKMLATLDAAGGK